MAEKFLEPQNPLKKIDETTGDVTYVYPLTTDKQVMMENGERLNTILKENILYMGETAEESVAEVINADTLGGQLPEYYKNADTLGGYSAEYFASAAGVEMVQSAAETAQETANANTSALGGLKFQKITQESYNALSTKDSSTLYIIVG